MDNNDRAEFAACFAEMMLCYRQSVEQSELLAWFNQLRDFPLESVKSAMQTVIRTEDYPTVGKLIKAITGSTKTIAQMAFQSAHRQVKCLGAGYSPIFDDPIIHQTINSMGGWIVFCASLNEKSAPFVEKNFIEAYIASTLKPMAPRQLVGKYGSESPIKMIGDQTKCKALTQLLELNDSRPTIQPPTAPQGDQTHHRRTQIAALRAQITRQKNQ